MLCERCHKQLATLKYTEVVNGKAYKRNLCERCLKELQADANSGFEVSGSAPSPKGIFASRSSAAKSEQQLEAKGKQVCQACGMRLSIVLKSNTVGCPDCYGAFKEEIEPVLRERHTALLHRGKIPRLEDNRTRLRLNLQSKRALLRSALRTEEYEQAAALRDEIRSLEQMISSSNPGTS